MYNSSVCYKHKGHKHEGHKHEVESAPPPSSGSGELWLVGLLFPDVIIGLILILVVAIKWVF